MLISEQILLLSTNDKGKHETSMLWNDMLLRSGLMADLVGWKLVTITDRTIRDPKITAAVPSAQVEHPVLRHGVEMIEKRNNRSTYDIIADDWFAKRKDVAQGLVAQGVLEETDGVFSFLSRNQFPTRDESVELQLRGRLEQFLRGQANPTLQESMLVALLDAYDAVRALLKEELRGMGRGEVKQAVRDVAALVTDPDLELVIKAANSAETSVTVNTTVMMANQARR